MKFQYFILVLSVVVLTSCSPSTTQSSSPAKVSAYIQNKGSDTLVNLALAWAERYQGEHPDVRISVTGGGSGTGIAALINKTVDIANASRQIKAEEANQAKAKGFTPVEFVVAQDAIAVIIKV